ncbi:MAG TPA: metal-dependent hydrolase [Clostridia bacterium]|nr:metal-dependent hydrolase [Clostridia bacterium]
MTADTIHVTWLGHSTFRIDTAEGKTIVIDPWVTSNPMCPEEQKRLNKIDVMLCTHGHFDHIGDAVKLAKQHKPAVVGIFELCAWMEKKGVKKTNPMNKGGAILEQGVKITMVHADHSCGITEDDGSIVYGGEPCGYVLEFENGLKLYHAGDTNVFGDMHIIRELYSPEIVMLPIGGHFTMGPREVEYACGLLRPKVLIPMHFGTFPLLSGKPEDLEKMAHELGIEVMAMTPGQTRQLHATAPASVTS